MERKALNIQLQEIQIDADFDHSVALGGPSDKTDLDRDDCQHNPDHPFFGLEAVIGPCACACA